MLKKFKEMLFGNREKSKQLSLKKFQPDVDRINAYFTEFDTLSDDELKAKTDEFRQRLQQGETEADLMHEAFAVVKQAAKRLVGQSWDVAGQPVQWQMVHYDEQLIGGIALFSGKIAEMATGEGKTLVATLPLYLNALSGKGAHLVTVNDYLAQRDSEWMGRIYNFLGLTVGCVLNGMPPHERVENYKRDITYGTNSEFGFDYLRDNMVLDISEMAQRGHNYAIVDEVDSVLIDEARTPLIIAGPVPQSTHKFNEMRDPVESLVRVQNRMMDDLLKEAAELLAKGDDESKYLAGKALLKVQRGAPKNPKLIDLISDDPGTQLLITHVESDYLREKKLHLLDEEMYFAIDEKSHTIDLSDMGRHKMAELTRNDESMFILPDLSVDMMAIEKDDTLDENEKQIKQDELSTLFADRSERIHNITQLLRAYQLYQKDVEYVVQNRKVQIVDEFTGRIMYGRRYSDGLHQAIEAKERVRIEQETQTVASITLQNYFRLYDRLAGMTGTAATEADEFFEIYGLETMVIPTHEPIRRLDQEDLIFRTKREKYEAVAARIKELHEQKQPVLVGTISVDVSEILHKMLKRAGVPNNVLNAKQHRKEALIVAGAGKAGAVTIATNMAGRGTDIKLGEGVIQWGGEPGDKDKATGGLHIIGTERHESRRIDLQLRGRAGRQGDPGESLFYLSLEDDLMRLFGSDRIAGIMDKLGVKEGEVITHSMITRSIEKAQKRVEEQNFAIRKHLLEYDDVMNQQRTVVYSRRKEILESRELPQLLNTMIEEYAEFLTEEYTGGAIRSEEWNWEGLRKDLVLYLVITIPEEFEKNPSLKDDDLRQFIIERTQENINRKRSLLGDEIMDMLLRYAMLRMTDKHWKEHLHEMDMLKEGIGFQAYAQKNPLTEYKRESYEMFTRLLVDVARDALQFINRVELEVKKEDLELQTPQQQQTQTVHKSIDGMHGGSPEVTTRESREASREKGQPVRKKKEPRPNDPCPCGSGKKYKQCHGRPGGKSKD